MVKWLETRQTEDPYFRLDSFDTPAGPGNKLFLANTGMASNLFDVRGYDSIIPSHYARFMQLIQANGDLLFNRVGPLYHDGYAALDSALLDFLGVRYILTTVNIANPNYSLVYDDEIQVYENLDALPRAVIVPEAQTVPPGDSPQWSDEFIFALRSLNPRQQVVLDGKTNGQGIDLTPAEAGPLAQPRPGVDIVDYTAREVRLAARLDQPGWLTLADTYFPGWRAYAIPPGGSPDDEIELTIHRANGAFRAVYLPPGAWQVRFRYSPRTFQLGLYGSFLALAALMFGLGYWAWGKLYRETDTDSPIKRVAKNSLVPMIMALSNRLIDFAFALLMLRILQPEGAGRYAFAVAFIGLAEIITRYGLGTLVTREVAADRSRTNRYLANVSLLRLFMWLAALPFMVAALALYVIFGDTTSDVLITVAILSVGTLLSNLSDGLTAIY